MPGVFKNLARQERGKSNLGGFARLVAYAESDFTAGWPIKTEIALGILSTAPPLKVGVIGAELTFDLSTGRGKSAKKGGLGYQNYEHEVDAKFAGCDPTQQAALELFLNEGGVIVGFMKDGKRRVYGASWNPLVIEDNDDSGAKADDQNSITFKGKGDGYDFHAPFLAPTVVLPTDATAVKPMPFATTPVV